MGHPRFQSGKITTKFLAEEYPTGFKGHQLNDKSFNQLAAVAGMVHAKREQRNRTWINAQNKQPQINSWEILVEAVGRQEKVQVQRISTELQRVMEYKVKIGNGEWQTAKMDWLIETPLVQVAGIAEEELTVQWIQAFPLGFCLQHYGTKVLHYPLLIL